MTQKLIKKSCSKCKTSFYAKQDWQYYCKGCYLEHKWQQQVDISKLTLKEKPPAKLIRYGTS